MTDSKEYHTLTPEYKIIYNDVYFLKINNITKEEEFFLAKGVNGYFSKNISYQGDIFTRKFENQGVIHYKYFIF